MCTLFHEQTVYKKGVPKMVKILLVFFNDFHFNCEINYAIGLLVRPSLFNEQR